MNEQIEEMRKDLTEIFDEEYEKRRLVTPQNTAEKMTVKGYRKQSEGEWVRQEKIKGKVTPEAVCSNCGREVVYQVIDNKWEFENYCPHCGAKMKGGAE